MPQNLVSNTLLSKVPILLICTRLVIGFVILAFSIARPGNYPTVAVVLLTIGLLTDILDGIIARKLGVSTTALRRLDSTVDQVFFISMATATYIQCPDFFKENATHLAFLMGLEALTYLVSFIRFKKEIATHSIGAKIWTIFIFATLIQLILQCRSGVLFQLCFWIGVLTRVEILAIILVLKNWTNDVPSVYHALTLRRGREITRHKLFNG